MVIKKTKNQRVNRFADVDKLQQSVDQYINDELLRTN
jgi:hypothetical protein